MDEKTEFKISDLVTIPNLLTYFRIVLIVPFVYFFIKEDYIMAVLFIGLSGLSDVLDGFLARKLNQITQLGKMLDPIADKLTLFSVALCMLIKFPKILPLAALLLLKELLMLVGGFVLIRNNIAPPASRWYGKAATVVFYLSMGTIIVLKAAFGYENDILVLVLFVVTTVCMLFALANYAYVFAGLMKNRNNKK